MAFELEQHEWLAEAFEREQRQKLAQETDPAQQALAARTKAQALKRLQDSKHAPGREVAEKERQACIDIVAFHGGSVEIEAAIRARGQQ